MRRLAIGVDLSDHCDSRRREDTIRVIVSNMNEHDLLEADDSAHGKDLISGEDTFARLWEILGEGGKNIRSSQALLEDEWEPEPIEALTGQLPIVLAQSRTDLSGCLAPDRALRPSHSRDLMSMLVSIYGHPELFVEEYVHMLANRMLSGQSDKVDIKHEVRYVNLLKQRFGDGGLQGCDVMLKDYDNSRIMNDLVRKQLTSVPGPSTSNVNVPINTLIISREYWPEVKFSPIELPEQLVNIQTAYTAEYEKLKAHRTLHWSPNYGLISPTLCYCRRKICF